MAKVSVVIPTYNRADLIGRAIQSVLDQTETDWECMVIDDGSQDNTKDVVGSYADSRIRYIYQSNQKVPAARNAGIKASDSQYITFLDSDDTFLPGKLETQLRFLQENPTVDLVVSGWIDVDQNGKLIRKFTPWNLNPTLDLQRFLFSCPLIVPAVMARKECLDAVGGFDAGQHYDEDWDLWLRLVYSGYKLAWHPVEVCCRTVHGNSLIRNVKAMTDGLIRLMEKFFAQPDLKPDLQALRNRVFARINLNGTARAIGIGEPDLAKTYLRQAIELNPALGAGKPPEFLSALASASLTEIAPDQDLYLTTWLRVLSDFPPQFTRSRRQLRALVWAVSAFDDWANLKKANAQKKAARAVILDPAWLLNRGFVKILLNF